MYTKEIFDSVDSDKGNIPTQGYKYKDSIGRELIVYKDKNKWHVAEPITGFDLGFTMANTRKESVRLAQIRLNDVKNKSFLDLSDLEQWREYVEIARRKNAQEAYNIIPLRESPYRGKTSYR